MCTGNTTNVPHFLCHTLRLFPSLYQFSSNRRSAPALLDPAHYPILSLSLGTGQHGRARVPVRCRVGHAATQREHQEGLAGAATHWGVDVSDLLGPADVDLVVVVLGGLAVHGVVEVHALGVLPPPVAPDQVAAGADQADDHCGKDRNCMRLTHSRHTMTGALTQPGDKEQCLMTHTHTHTHTRTFTHMVTKHSGTHQCIHTVSRTNVCICDKYILKAFL